MVIEWRSANGDYALVPALATDLVQRKVDVIVVQKHARSRCGQARHVYHTRRHGLRR